MNDRDPEAIWGLMGSNAIAQADKDLAKLKSGEDAEGKMALAFIGISESELATMDSKQFFIKTLSNMFSMMAEMEKASGQKAVMDFDIGEAKINGNRATVSVTNKTQGKTQELPLIKEGDVWMFDANPMGN
jgi:hypothetical protein